MPLDISSGGAGSIATPGLGPPVLGASASNPMDVGLAFATLLQGLGGPPIPQGPANPTLTAKTTAAPSKVSSFSASDTQEGGTTTEEETDTDPQNNNPTPTGLPITPMIVPILSLPTPIAPNVCRMQASRPGRPSQWTP